MAMAQQPKCQIIRESSWSELLLGGSQESDYLECSVRRVFITKDPNDVTTPEFPKNSGDSPCLDQWKRCAFYDVRFRNPGKVGDNWELQERQK